jgi:uncharacterized membrane protein YbjE (DUF340 family)
MLIFIAIMTTGFLVGWAVRGRARFITRVGALTRPVIFALLFLMGISIGLDDRTMTNLGAIGLNSLGFAVLTSAGSMAVLALVLPFLRHVRPPPPTSQAAEAAEAEIVREAEREGEALVK